jgi:dihydrofolate reductase
MRTLTVYNFMSLDGYFEGPENGEFRWHVHGADQTAYSVEMLRQHPTLLFGRVTYRLMADYWPRPGPMRDDPEVARGMNGAEKIVFSRTLTSVDWQGSRLAKRDLFDEVRALKAAPGGNMMILGSGTLVAQLAGEGLIDHFEFLVDPLLVGRGTNVTQGLDRQVPLQLTRTHVYPSGVVLLCYRTNMTVPL